MTKFIDKSGFDNVEQVRKWYLGIQSTFKQIQKQNNYDKKQAWDKLKIELLKSVAKEDFVQNDPEWVEDLLFHEIIPTTEEACRFEKKYPNQTPLIDALAKIF